MQHYRNRSNLQNQPAGAKVQAVHSAGFGLGTGHRQESQFCLAERNWAPVLSLMRDGNQNVVIGDNLKEEVPSQAGFQYEH